MVKNEQVRPFLKWVGGKRHLIPEIRKLLPADVMHRPYYEPFIGGGALFFDLQPRHAVINDFNKELMNVYKVVRDNPDALIADLKKHENTSTYFYSLRSVDRQEDFGGFTNIERASRIIYLNKTCYNGLYRVNNAGEFNSPYGNYKNPNIVNEAVLKAVSGYLNSAAISIADADYQEVLKDIPSDAFVYLDPPYHPISRSSAFTGYVGRGWTKNDQLKLRDVCNLLTIKGIKFLLSNSASDFIRDIYSDYFIHVVQAPRPINSVSTKRGLIDEFLISNYE